MLVTSFELDAKCAPSACLIINAMPRARGRIRLNIGPPSTRASFTTRLPTFGARRSSALPKRALDHLLQHPRTALRLIPQDVQRIVGTLAANQVGQRAHLAGADPSESMSGFVGHGIVLFATHCRCSAAPSCRRASASFFDLAAVAAEGARRGELAQPVADHVFRHEHFQVHLAVVNHERVADELRHDRAGPGPGLDRLLRADRVHPLHLAEQLRIDERTFFQRSSHSSCFAFRLQVRLRGLLGILIWP